MSVHSDRSTTDPSVTPDAAEPALEATFPPLAEPDRADPATVEALAAYRDAARERDRVERAFKRHLSPTALELYRALSDAIDNERCAATDLHVAELARHLPGFGPALRLLWAHVIDCRLDRVGSCCTTGPVEP